MNKFIAWSQEKADIRNGVFLGSVLSQIALLVVSVSAILGK